MLPEDMPYERALTFLRARSPKEQKSICDVTEHENFKKACLTLKLELGLPEKPPLEGCTGRRATCTRRHHEGLQRCNACLAI